MNQLDYRILAHVCLKIIDLKWRLKDASIINNLILLLNFSFQYFDCSFHQNESDPYCNTFFPFPINKASKISNLFFLAMLSIRRSAVPARYMHEKFGFKTNVIGRRESPHSVLGLAEGASAAEIKLEV